MGRQLGRGGHIELARCRHEMGAGRADRCSIRKSMSPTILAGVGHGSVTMLSATPPTAARRIAISRRPSHREQHQARDVDEDRRDDAGRASSPCSLPAPGL
jgi:hypothetical protein